MQLFLDCEMCYGLIDLLIKFTLKEMHLIKIKFKKQKLRSMLIEGVINIAIGVVPNEEKAYKTVRQKYCIHFTENHIFANSVLFIEVGFRAITG